MSQDDILSTKGCKRDPYSETEYSNYTGEWKGGWIRNSSNGSIQFRNSNGYVQQTITKGQSANPYTEYEYDYKLNQEMNWPGGWVVNTDLSIRYINAYNEQGESFSLGKRQNPYYYVEFHNLYVRYDWHGGWVEYESGGRVYINAHGEEDEDPAASGSGCGSVSGSGSGDLATGFLTAGSAQCMFVNNSDTIRVKIAWSSGHFNALDSPPTLSYDSGNSYYTHLPVQSGPLYSINLNWSQPYRVRIQYSYPYGSGVDYYDIPEHYSS